MKGEVAHLEAVWDTGARLQSHRLVDEIVPPSVVAHLDRFDRAQLEDVLRVCRSTVSLSAAGRVLFDHSRERKKMANDADRLRKYLARFDLDWSEVKASPPRSRPPL